jgi:chromosome segregation protein
VQRSLEETSQAAKEANSRHNDVRISVAQKEERFRSIRKELTASQEAARQATRRLEQLDAELERDSVELSRLTEEAELHATREEDLIETRAEQCVVIERLRQRSAELADSVRTQEDDATRLDKRIRGLKETVHTLDLDAVKLEQSIESIVDRITERYGLDPRTVPAPSVPPDGGELHELREKLQSMGEVNLAALDESRLVEERLAFLSEQENDLKQAVDSLYSTINAINRTTQERFREAFDRVNEKFQEIFPFLFGGGEARLELTDEEDLLETGVEIMARPPGKRVRNMDLLSGGEKALTAVALIFAIFLIRPSPFCLLDEVDAPLDDANLGRFNEMLQRLSSETQFLVITHNKMTMQAADCLYGVTMDEPGVSRVVSVAFA